MIRWEFPGNSACLFTTTFCVLSRHGVVWALAQGVFRRSEESSKAIVMNRLRPTFSRERACDAEMRPMLLQCRRPQLIVLRRTSLRPRGHLLFYHLSVDRFYNLRSLCVSRLTKADPAFWEATCIAFQLLGSGSPNETPGELSRPADSRVTRHLPSCAACRPRTRVRRTKPEFCNPFEKRRCVPLRTSALTTKIP